MIIGCLAVVQSWNVAGLIPIISPRLQIFNDKSLIFYICSKEDMWVARRVTVMISICGTKEIIGFDTMRRRM